MISSLLSIDKAARFTVILLFFSWLIDYIDRLVITLALPDIGKTFSLSPVEMGAVVSAFAVTYALFQIPGGIIADRFGARRVMVGTMAVWSVFTALTGVVGSYFNLLVVRSLFGVGEALFPAASMKAIGERVPQKQRITANSIMLSSNSFGAAIAPLIAGPAIALVGWRHSFFIVMGLGFLMSIILWTKLPAPMSGVSANNQKNNTETLGVGAKISDVLFSGIIWRFALLFGSFCVVIWGLLAWVPTYLINARHLHIVVAGFYTSIPWFCGAIGTIIGGILFDKFFSNRFRLLVVPVEIIGAIFLFLMTRSNSTIEYVVFLSLALFFLQMAFLPIFGLPLRLLSPHVMATGGSIINFGGQMGGFIAPISMGWIIQHFSYDMSFNFLIFALFVSALTAFSIPQSFESFREAIRKV